MNDNEFLELLQKSKELDLIKDKAIKDLQEKLKEQTEINKTAIKIITNDELLDMRQVAKILNYQISDNKYLGRNQLFEILRKLEILMEGYYGTEHNQPYQKFVDKSYFVLKESYNDTMNKVLITTLVTQKGLHFIRQILDDYFNKGVIE